MAAHVSKPGVEGRGPQVIQSANVVMCSAQGHAGAGEACSVPSARAGSTCSAWEACTTNPRAGSGPAQQDASMHGCPRARSCHERISPAPTAPPRSRARSYLVTPRAPPQLPLAARPRHPDVDDPRPRGGHAALQGSPPCVRGGGCELAIRVLRHPVGGQAAALPLTLGRRLQRCCSSPSGCGWRRGSGGGTRCGGGGSSSGVGGGWCARVGGSP